MKITLIRPSLGKVHSEYNLDEGAMEPLQMALIAGLIKEPDQVVLYDDRVEEIPFDEATDLVAISVTSFAAARAYEIASKYRAMGVKVIMGGIHVTLLPEEAKQHCDSVVVGDVEHVWKILMDDFKKDQLKGRYEAEFLEPQAGCFPDRSLFKGKKYLPVSLVQFSRGCKFNCSFCSVSRFFKNKHKCRNIDDVIYEIEKDNLKTILFVDDNLVANKKELKTFLKELIPLKIKWASQTTIDMVNDEELLKLMADSGCVGNLIGIESIDKNSLKLLKKTPNLLKFNNYEEPLKILRDHGFLTWASFILGNDMDNLESIQRTVDFALKNKFTLAFFHMLMPYPKTALYEQFLKKDRLLYNGKWWLDTDYRYNHAPFLPKEMSPHELSEATIKANKEFYSIKSITHRLFDRKTNLKDWVNFMIFARFNYVIRKTST